MLLINTPSRTKDSQLCIMIQWLYLQWM